MPPNPLATRTSSNSVTFLHRLEFGTTNTPHRTNTNKRCSITGVTVTFVNGQEGCTGSYTHTHIRMGVSERFVRSNGVTGMQMKALARSSMQSSPDRKKSCEPTISMLTFFLRVSARFVVQRSFFCVALACMKMWRAVRCPRSRVR